MSDETTTEQLAEIEGQGDTIQVREGRWRTRGGNIRNVTPTPKDDGETLEYSWWDAKYLETWTAGGKHYRGSEGPLDLVKYLGPIEPDKTQELPTKTQELETKTQELQAEYAPPEGWRVVRFGEQLLPGDVWVNHDGTEQRSNILQWDASAVSGGRCIRRIKPEAQPEPDAELQAQVAFLKGREVTLGTRLQQEREVTTRLRGELESVQNLLGGSRQRVTQLEELVVSLRTINTTQEKAFTAAGKENTALRNQRAAVKAELANVAADRQQLRVELDAAQQVPADSPELRQLRADLEQAILGRDMYQDGYSRALSDLETIRETTKAETVEVIAEWLEPIRLVDSAYLANATIQHLPKIMRTLTGLDSHAID